MGGGKTDKMQANFYRTSHFLPKRAKLISFLTPPSLLRLMPTLTNAYVRPQHCHIGNRLLTHRPASRIPQNPD